MHQCLVRVAHLPFLLFMFYFSYFVFSVVCVGFQCPVFLPVLHSFDYPTTLVLLFTLRFNGTWYLKKLLLIKEANRNWSLSYAYVIYAYLSFKCVLCLVLSTHLFKSTSLFFIAQCIFKYFFTANTLSLILSATNIISFWYTCLIPSQLPIDFLQ